jgi:hypothetical protein
MIYKTWGFHGSDYEECRLQGYKSPVHTLQETHYVSATELNRWMICKIWGFHGSGYEECRLLGCYVVWVIRIDVSEEYIASIIRVTTIIANVFRLHLFFLPWRWKRCISLTCLFLQELRVITSQKTAFFVFLDTFKEQCKLYVRDKRIGTRSVLQRSQTSLSATLADCSYYGILPHVICILRTQECDLAAWQDGMSPWLHSSVVFYVNVAFLSALGHDSVPIVSYGDLGPNGNTKHGPMWISTFLRQLHLLPTLAAVGDRTLCNSVTACRYRILRSIVIENCMVEN